jgi:hypothetical protein
MNFENFPPSLLILSPRLTRTGAPDASVGGLNTTPLADGCLCYCVENTAEYQLDKTSTAAPGLCSAWARRSAATAAEIGRAHV